MKTTTIIANWKMNGTHSTARNLLDGLRPELKAIPVGVDVVICPPFTMLDLARHELEGLKAYIGAQNCHYSENGAFTGEVSAPMLTEAGVTHVILGHSERRQYAGEDNELITKKLQAAKVAGLKTILCVGESLEEREAGKAEDVVGAQLKAVNAKQNAAYIAYEPIWAIGTGKTPTEVDIAAMHDFIYQQTGGALPILYGGSVNAKNAASLLSLPRVDGALVGGASLAIDSFSQILHSAYAKDQ